MGTPQQHAAVKAEVAKLVENFTSHVVPRPFQPQVEAYFQQHPELFEQGTVAVIAAYESAAPKTPHPPGSMPPTG